MFLSGPSFLISSLWMVLWHLGEGRVGRGLDSPPRCPLHRYPGAQGTPKLRHRDPSTAPSPGYPSTQLPQYTATPPTQVPSPVLTHQYTSMHSGTQHMAVLEQGHPKTQPLALRYLSAPAMPCVAPAWAHRGICCSLGQVRLVQFPFNPKHHEPYSKGNAKGF